MSEESAAGDAGGDDEEAAAGADDASADGAPDDEQRPGGAGDPSADDTVPEVELGLYQVSVRVKGDADDDLESVEETATRLVDHLVDRAEALEEEPDKRGLG
ncbi:hypothetical protein [Halobaculum sp. P14]|uniref:hypothetical protein n=1 Tax=Halobaculum sp. P14 TaxID=3421638 RepID=UPI003EBA3AC8